MAEPVTNWPASARLPQRAHRHAGKAERRGDDSAPGIKGSGKCSELGDVRRPRSRPRRSRDQPAPVRAVAARRRPRVALAGRSARSDLARGRCLRLHRRRDRWAHLLGRTGARASLYHSTLRPSGPSDHERHRLVSPKSRQGSDFDARRVHRHATLAVICRRGPGSARRKPPVGDRAHRVPVPGGRRAVGDRGASRRVPAAAVSVARSDRRRPSCASPSPASCRITPPRRCCGCWPASRSPPSPASPSASPWAARALAEDIFLPLVSIGAPIPGVAYAPLFLLWFGLGNLSAVLLVALRLGVPDHLQHLDRREGGEGNLGALGAGDGRRRPAPVPPRDPAGRAALHPHRVCGSAWRRPGASWWRSRCWRRCRGDWAG